jgi:hypothetical protein
MSKTRSRRPASETRAVRRSLVELTAVASRAVDDGLLPEPAIPHAASLEQPPRLEVVAEEPLAKRLERRDPAEQAAAPRRVAESRNTLVRRASERDYSDSAAELVVQIAKDYQSRLLDNIKAGLNAVLDHAKDFAETPARSKGGAANPEKDRLIALSGTTDEFRAEALKFMHANVATALDYARELAGTRTAAEFVELSGTQARKQCELMLKQAEMLRSLAQAATTRGENQPGTREVPQG